MASFARCSSRRRNDRRGNWAYRRGYIYVVDLVTEASMNWGDAFGEVFMAGIIALILYRIIKLL